MSMRIGRTSKSSVHGSAKSNDNRASATKASPEKMQPHFSSLDHLNPEAVAAFVDEELSPLAMQRARLHLIHCGECRTEIANQRKASQALKEAAAQEEIVMPSGLLDRLSGIATNCPSGPDATQLEKSQRGMHRAYRMLKTIIDRPQRGK